MGDLLAARFMAVHQSVVDQNWSAARHLELLPYEEASAAGPAVILQARKHAALATRISQGDRWGWSASNKGKGYKGASRNWSDGEWQSDGKGKGKKGKGKEKGKNAWSNKGSGISEGGDAKKKEKIPE
eukprot:Skav208030  [mRNA]  locus=scaffold2714:530698:531081:- [translate_table: standard]